MNFETELSKIRIDMPKLLTILTKSYKERTKEDKEILNRWKNQEINLDKISYQDYNKVNKN